MADDPLPLPEPPHLPPRDTGIPVARERPVIIDPKTLDTIGNIFIKAPAIAGMLVKSASDSLIQQILTLPKVAKSIAEGMGSPDPQKQVDASLEFLMSPLSGGAARRAPVPQPRAVQKPIPARPTPLHPTVQTDLMSHGSPTGELSQYKTSIRKQESLTGAEIRRVTQGQAARYLPKTVTVYRGEYPNPQGDMLTDRLNEVVSVSLSPTVSDRFGKGGAIPFEISRDKILGWPAAIYGHKAPYPYEQELLVKRGDLVPSEPEGSVAFPGFVSRDVRKALRMIDPVQYATRLGLPPDSATTTRVGPLLEKLSPSARRLLTGDEKDLGARVRGPVYIEEGPDGWLIKQNSETVQAALAHGGVDIPVVILPGGFNKKIPYEAVIDVPRRFAAPPPGHERPVDEMRTIAKRPVILNNGISRLPSYVDQSPYGRIYKIVEGLDGEQVVVDGADRIISIGQDEVGARNLIRRLKDEDTLSDAEAKALKPSSPSQYAQDSLKNAIKGTYDTEWDPDDSLYTPSPQDMGAPNMKQKPLKWKHLPPDQKLEQVPFMLDASGKQMPGAKSLFADAEKTLGTKDVPVSLASWVKHSPDFHDAIHKHFSSLKAPPLKFLSMSISTPAWIKYKIAENQYSAYNPMTDTTLEKFPSLAELNNFIKGGV